MTFISPYIKVILPSLWMLLLFSGCQMFFDEIGECINKISPKLPSKLLSQGQIGTAYFESIQAEVKNGDSDTFEYEFSIVSGDLPDGISFSTDGRLFKLLGTPLKSGTFTFKLKVKIPSEIYGPGDGICFGKVYDKEEYKITILE